MYDVAIIGTSAFASTYVKALKKNEKVKNIYCLSKSIERGINFSKKYKINFLKSLEDIVSMKNIFAVIIANDPRFHLKTGKELIESNKHILIEKPLDTNIDLIKEFILHSKKVKQTISVSGQYKYYPIFKKIKTKIDNGSYGELIFTNISMSLNRSISSYKKGNGWKLEFGHTALNHAIHYLDLALFLFGKLDSYFISQESSRISLECKDTCVIVLIFNNGHYVTVNATTGSQKTSPDIFTFVTRKKNFSVKIPRSRLANRFYNSFQSLVFYKNPFEIQLNSFLDKAEKGVKDIESLERGRLAVEIASNYFSTYKKL